MTSVPTTSGCTDSAPDPGAVRAALADPSILDQLSSWMSTQRWYAGKGRTRQLRVVGGYGLTDPIREAGIRVAFVLDEGDAPQLYQVPLTARHSPLPALAESLVATGTTGSGEELYLYDGPHDPAFAQELLSLILNEGKAIADLIPATGAATGAGSAEHPVQAVGHRAGPGPATEVVTSRVLSGEQSNTSIVYELKDADGTPSAPVICKLFRAVHHGDNPDIVLLDALGAAACPVVPHSVGHISAEWSDIGRPGGIATGHLAFAQEFLPGVEDAWRVTLRAAEEGRDFTIEARALGEATAEVHKALARALGTSACTEAGISDSLESMRGRLRLAVEEIPELAEWQHEIETVYARAATASWPKLQRIHGDLHLGQVLAVPGRGWVLLDFEGEPLRPMSERSKPDSPLRDVAGMLRSFDYVAGTFALEHPGHNVTDWALACRQAFVSGYSGRTGHNLQEHRVLLDAFEIDKAIYEAVYEARNRPTWLPIPVVAIKRLAGLAGAS